MVETDQVVPYMNWNGHPAGDACLDKVIGAVETVVGHRGKVYRWGGDEFAICLPDFSTTEAVATAERVRAAVEKANAGGDIPVTTSVGVCGSDRIDSKSPEEFFDFADKAMYKSKHTGKNRVTAWPLTGVEVADKTPRLGEEERRKLADSVIVTVKTSNGHHRQYTISVKNHSKKIELEVKGICAMERRPAH